VMYLSLIPQFVVPARGHVLAQGFLLGAVQIAVALTVNLLIVLAAGTVSGLLSRRPGWLRVQRWLMATVLGGLAVRLLADHARPSVA
jgi:threonine/homoserine/homoserine lactone efflux protein